MRAIGARQLTASIINVTIGAGIFVLPAVAAAGLGAAAPMAYIVCAGLMVLIVCCFAAAGSRVSLTGGVYAYVDVAFGPFVGFLAGVLYILMATFASASVSSAFVGSVGALWPVAASPAARAILIAALFAVLAAVNVRGVKPGVRLVEAMTIAKSRSTSRASRVAARTTSTTQVIACSHFRNSFDKASGRWHRRLGGRAPRECGVFMVTPSLGLRLRDTLGPEASQDLSNAFEEVQNDMLTMTCDRFERRLIAVGSELRSEIYRTQSELRQEMARMDAGLRIALTEGLSKIRTDMSDMRVDVIRWSFLFWIGQFAATAALLGYMLRSVAR